MGVEGGRAGGGEGLQGNKDRHKISDGFEFGPGQTSH